MKNLKLLIFLLFSLSQNTQAQEPVVNTQLGDFDDVSRDRQIPYKVYYPESLEGKHPVIIFSHGLGAQGRQLNI